MNQEAEPPAWFSDLVVRWIALVSGRPWLTISVLMFITVAAAMFAVSRFSINSNLNDLVQQNTSWRVDFDRYKDMFPQRVNTILVVLSGPSRDDVRGAARKLTGTLSQHPDFEDVFAPEIDPFIDSRSLLFLSMDQLESVVNQLARAQPVLATLSRDPSLAGYLELIRSALDSGETLPDSFTLLTDQLTEALWRSRTEPYHPLGWGDTFMTEDEDAHYLVVTLKGRRDFGAALPNALLMDGLRQVFADLRTRTPPDVQFRVTGELALSHEEIQAAQSGVGVTGALSFILLAIILTWGVRSWRVVAATYLMLVMGLIWTTALGLVTVGEFSTLSIVFLVMFLGLAVDFSIHFCLRIQEEIRDGAEAPMLAAGRGVSTALGLCALTSGVGFLAFAPTDYRGLADLGVISAGGMVVAFLLSVTFLPVFFTLTGAPPPLKMNGEESISLTDRLLPFRIPVLLLALLLGLVAAWQASHMRFDFSVLAIKDPKSESMSTFNELRARGVVTDYALTVLAQPDQIGAIKAALTPLPSVREVDAPADLVPAQQEDKRLLLDDAESMLWTALHPDEVIEARSDEDTLVAVNAVLIALAQPRDDVAPGVAQSMSTLRTALSAEAANMALLRRTETILVSGIASQIEWLRSTIAATPFTFEELPAALRDRVVAGGVHVVSVLPTEDISNVQHLDHFIREVRAVEPDATGRPVLEWGVGNIVVGSFFQAMFYALVAIALILLLALRSVGDMLLVFIPLVLAAVCTLATAVLLDLSLNMANIIVMPLVFGLGVDNGIHVVHRFRAGDNVIDLLKSSTPRAVTVSGMTTVGTFAALSLSAHQGMASIGIFLSIAIAFLLLFTVILLPLLLHTKSTFAATR